jgi:AcrR family transcriptional regulator
MSAQKRLHTDDLVTTALAVTDTEGLDAVTIRRLAQHHGVTPMALYRHFPDKDGLLEAIADHLLAQVRPPAPDDRPWHEQLRDVLTALLDAIRPHPNAAPLLFTRMLASPPALAVTERFLALLTEGGLTHEEAVDTACQTLACLVSLVIADPARTHGPTREAREEAIRAKKALLLTLSPHHYPHIVASADAFATYAARDAYYHRGIDLIVKGIHATALQPAGQ